MILKYTLFLFVSVMLSSVPDGAETRTEDKRPVTFNFRDQDPPIYINSTYESQGSYATTMNPGMNSTRSVYRTSDDFKTVFAFYEKARPKSKEFAPIGCGYTVTIKSVKKETFITIESSGCY